LIENRAGPAHSQDSQDGARSTIFSITFIENRDYEITLDEFTLANDTSQLTNRRKESRDSIGRVARRGVYQINWNFHREHAVAINRPRARARAHRKLETS